MRKKKHINNKNNPEQSYYQGESRYREMVTATSGQASDDYFQGKIDEDVNSNSLKD